MTIFKENKDNLLPCSLKTEYEVGLQRSYWVRASENTNKVSGHYMCFQALKPDKSAIGFKILAMMNPIMKGTISGSAAM